MQIFLSKLALFADEEGMGDDQLPDEHLFSISEISPWFVDIANYLVVGKFPPNLIQGEKKYHQKKCPFHMDWGEYFQARP